MSPKRPSASSGDSAPHKRLRYDHSSPTNVVRIHVIQAKLDETTLHDLYAHTQDEARSPVTIESLGCELCSDPADADVIITDIHMKKRLQRHVDWDIAKQKSIVTPSWLLESLNQGRLLACGAFAALSELADQTAQHCPDNDHKKPTTGISAARQPLPLHSVKPMGPEVARNWRSRYACTRASPLICPNQALVRELDVLYRSRDLDGLRINALSYERAIAALKSYPYPITENNFERDVVKLPGLGGKTLSKIQEFLDKGHIEEIQIILKSERYQTLSLFSKIYGIGPATARKLYDLGLRTIKDLENYYDIPSATDPEEIDAANFTPNGGHIVPSDEAPDISIKFALMLREEFEAKISREEIEDMHQTLMAEMNLVLPGCVSTIVGGYRRGKEESSDVDIVISNPDFKDGAKRLRQKLTNRLLERGLLTNVARVADFHSSSIDHKDTIANALTVFIQPEGTKYERIHRRLDLIFAAPEAYWTAIVGWSGSKMFERDLRLWAKQEKGMKFDSSGLTRRHDSRMYHPHSEEAVFELLGLMWIDPTMRNADA